MARSVDLFCEDRGHEQFVRPLVTRLASKVGVNVQVRVRSARGGHGRAESELKAWQRAATRLGDVPDLLIVVIDGNCTGWHAARAALLEVIDTSIFPHVVIGCPDPHVERWCLADPLAFQAVVGVPPPPDPGKCERDLYKKLLRTALEQAHQPILTDVMEYAPELVERADLYTLQTAEPSLAKFVTALDAALKRLAPA